MQRLNKSMLVGPLYFATHDSDCHRIHAVHWRTSHKIGRTDIAYLIHNANPNGAQTVFNRAKTSHKREFVVFVIVFFSTSLLTLILATSILLVLSYSWTWKRNKWRYASGWNENLREICTGHTNDDYHRSVLSSWWYSIYGFFSSVVINLPNRRTDGCTQHGCSRSVADELSSSQLSVERVAQQARASVLSRAICPGSRLLTITICVGCARNERQVYDARPEMRCSTEMRSSARRPIVLHSRQSVRKRRTHYYSNREAHHLHSLHIPITLRRPCLNEFHCVSFQCWWWWCCWCPPLQTSPFLCLLRAANIHAKTAFSLQFQRDARICNAH